MKYSIVMATIALLSPPQSYPDIGKILKKIDDNLISSNKVMDSQMIVHGRRNSRTMSLKTYEEGRLRSFTEYFSPAREKGTKMLKLENQLWIYSPSTDRTIQLSGHMLRQSVMGSDLSYEDMMEDRKLTDLYQGKIVGEETFEGRKVWVLELTARVEDVAYHKRKSWVDQERFLPLKEELFAKSGQPLKRVIISDIVRMDNRWYPKKMNYKDLLKKGKGTDFIIEKIAFNTTIPDYIFTKAALKR